MTDLIEWVVVNGWLYVGSFAGSIAATWTMRELSLSERAQALVVGTLFGWFTGPFICEIWFSQYGPQSKVPPFICFLSGMVALGVIPPAIKKAKTLVQNYRILPVERADD